MLFSTFFLGNSQGNRTALDKNLINFCRYPLDPEDGASRTSLYERHAKSGPNQNIISERSISPDLVRENRDAKQKTTLFLKPPYNNNALSSNRFMKELGIPISKR